VRQAGRPRLRRRRCIAQFTCTAPPIGTSAATAALAHWTTRARHPSATGLSYQQLWLIFSVSAARRGGRAAKFMRYSLGRSAQLYFTVGGDTSA
jgi:hypothetical protein